VAASIKEVSVMIAGTVKTPNARGFAFVKLDSGGDEVFCHASQFEGEFNALHGGERVRVGAIVVTQRGRQCEGVRLLA
jgi:cold shock CspA family protein